MNKKDQVMTELWELFNKKMWLDGYKLKTRLKGYNPSEVHCIEFIEENEDSNVTKLAESFYMTRSAISKLTKKLIEKGLIESYQKPENKKEIYFKLTKQGYDVYNVHEELHKEYEKRDRVVFDQITEEQCDSMLSFTETFNKHLDSEIKKLDVDVTSGWRDNL